MGKVTNVLEEVAIYFGSAQFGARDLASPPLTPGSHGDYTPATDMRLVNLLVDAKKYARSDYARVKRVIDDLPSGIVTVLRDAWRGLRASIGCELPAAQTAAKSEGIDVAYARQSYRERYRTKFEQELEDVWLDARDAGCSSIATAMRVLERDAQHELGVLRVKPTALDLIAATRVAIHAGVIDVDAEIDAVIEAAVDAYIETRERLLATKRKAKAELARKNAELLDELLGKKKRREKARFDARMRRAS